MTANLYFITCITCVYISHTDAYFVLCSIVLLLVCFICDAKQHTYHCSFNHLTVLLACIRLCLGLGTSECITSVITASVTGRVQLRRIQMQLNWASAQQCGLVCDSKIVIYDSLSATYNGRRWNLIWSGSKDRQQTAGHVRLTATPTFYRCR